MTDTDAATGGGIAAAITGFLGAVGIALRKWGQQQGEITSIKTELVELRKDFNEVSETARHTDTGLNALVAAYTRQTEILADLSKLMQAGAQSLHDIQVEDRAYREGVVKQLDRMEGRLNDR